MLIQIVQFQTKNLFVVIVYQDFLIIQQNDY